MYMFHYSQQRRTEDEVARLNDIARRATDGECDYWYCDDLHGQGPCGWFAGPNYGAPHDENMAESVLEAVRARMPEYFDE